VAEDAGGQGWWLASDGRWYPPELHPGTEVRSDEELEPKAPLPELDWAWKRLRFGGSCINCGNVIEKGAMGWHNPEIKKVRCSLCPPRPEMAHSDPIGGSSAFREAQRRGDQRWQKGAVGEYLMAQHLHRELTHGEVILSDRQLPDSQANVDFAVVASSGIWVIDAKKWAGKIEYKSTNFWGTKMGLFVGGKDRTPSIERIYNLVIPVRQLVPDWSVPVEPALVFVDGDWSDRATGRLVARRPYQHGKVWIGAPQMITRKIKEPGYLNIDDVARLGAFLDQALPPR